jgi:hypothetical protein
MKLKKIVLRPATILIAILLLQMVFAPVSLVLADTQSNQTQLLSLNSFVESVQNSNPSQITGIYVQNVMAFPVVQQPSSQAGYVSTQNSIVTQFGLASDYGSIGILAHNYLAGAQFFNIMNGSIISLVYGNGHVEYYKVTIVKQYQALSPNSVYSQFINLAQPDVTLSSTDLFYQTYGLGNVLVLQTCILANNDPSWGRLFIIAEPFEYLPVVPVKSPISENDIRVIS